MMDRYSVIILLLVHPICAKIYFTNKFLTIHAKKDISQFSKNENNLNEVISKLETTKTTFNNKQFNATFGSADLSFNYWLGSQIANCIKSLNSKKSRAKDLPNIPLNLLTKCSTHIIAMIAGNAIG